MRFQELSIPGVYLIEPEKKSDERGSFARVWCKKEAQQFGLDVEWVQNNLSENKRKGTLRGMHYQAAPYGEIKLVQVFKGEIFDVVLDVRPESPTYKKWAGVELSAENSKLLWIPKGIAHGFQTLADNTTILYHMSEYFYPNSQRGIRYDDPVFGINWPKTEERIIAGKDISFPLWN